MGYLRHPFCPRANSPLTRRDVHSSLACAIDFCMVTALNSKLDALLHSRLSIRMRLVLVSLVGAVGFIILGGIAMHAVRQQMIEDRLTKIRQLTEVARGVMQWQYQRQLSGEIDETTAKKMALDQLRTMRYGNDEYFFVDDFNCVSILLPNIPEWEGRNFSNEVDSHGKYFVREQRDAALAGGGTVYYTFPKQNSERSVDKAAFILPFMPWQWLIGTGVYLDEVDQEIQEILLRLLAGFFAVVAICGMLVVHISRGITLPLEKLTRVIHRLTARDYQVVVEGKERSDEIGDIARALEIFKRTGLEFEALQQELRIKEAAANEERAAWFEQQRESALRLEQSSRLISVGEMATSLAHDLNQPLASITNYCRGCVNLLETGRGDQATLLEPMRQATREAIRASRIIARIRNYLRRNEASLDPQDLREIVDETVHLAELEAQRRGIVIRVVAMNLPRVMADRIMIQQVILNLIRNAIEVIDAASAPEYSLIVNFALTDCFVETQVIDHGPGVSEDGWTKIFEPFYTTKPEGMGMGLSICRSVIELHGGRIWVNANPTGGAIFHFTLPRADLEP